MLEREAAPFDEISIVFLGERGMQRLNRTFTGRDEPTDTLAFELTPSMAGLTRSKQRLTLSKPRGEEVSGAKLEVPGIRLGEVIVCPDLAVVQSKKYRVSLEKELTRLVIHGLLHLCGFDDTTEKGRARMHKRENLYIASLGDEISSLAGSMGKGYRRGTQPGMQAGSRSRPRRGLQPQISRKRAYDRQGPLGRRSRG